MEGGWGTEAKGRRRAQCETIGGPDIYISRSIPIPPLIRRPPSSSECMPGTRSAMRGGSGTPRRSNATRSVGVLPPSLLPPLVSLCAPLTVLGCTQYTMHILHFISYTYIDISCHFLYVSTVYIYVCVYPVIFFTFQAPFALRLPYYSQVSL